MELIRQIVTTEKPYDFKTFGLAASVCHPRDMVKAALAGGDICTGMSIGVCREFIKHP